MQKKAASQSGIFNPRVLLAFTLCSVGSLLAIFSLAATPPVETTHANTSMPTDSRNFLSTFSSGVHHLPPGVPLPPGTQFSFNGQGDPLKQQPTAGFPGFAGMPFRPGTASGANALGTPRFANQQPAPLSMPQPFASQSTPLVSGAQSNDWSIVSSPNTSATQSNALRGVACVSASECWAVGYYLADNAAQTLIERWDGTSWAIVSSPNTSSTQSNFLLGVTCASASECWAVGYYYNDNVISQTLIERWDGTSWTIVSSPNTSATDYNSLSGVTCVSASECWAVGYYFTSDNFVDQTLIERWDGTSWTIVNSPNTSTTEANVVLGVTCVSASECWAVGYYYGLDDLISQTLIERWDGTSWTIVNSPNTNTLSNVLLGVTCGSASDCWAVGNYAVTGNVLQTLIERWDGTSWSIVSSPNTSTSQSNFLYSVTCGPASDCWAVGYYIVDAVSNLNQTLIERWDGISWEIVSSPNTSTTQSNSLYSVTCGSTSDCWAVGYYFNASSVAQTLTLRSAATPTPTPTPTGTPTPTASPRPTPTPRPRPAPPPRPTPPR